MGRLQISDHKPIGAKISNRKALQVIKIDVTQINKIQDQQLNQLLAPRILIQLINQINQQTSKKKQRSQANKNLRTLKIVNQINTGQRYIIQWKNNIQRKFFQQLGEQIFQMQFKIVIYSNHQILETQGIIQQCCNDWVKKKKLIT